MKVFQRLVGSMVRCRKRLYSALPLRLKVALVGCRSVTRVPEGALGNDWLFRAADPFLKLCEKSVWWIGLVRAL